MQNLQISLAEAADLEGLLDLYRHLNPEDEPCPTAEAAVILEHIALYQGSAILIGKHAGHIVGSCTLIVIPNLTRQGRPYALIENVVTHDSWRRKGFGAALLNAATELAWAQNCYKVMLMASSQDPGTHAFYKMAGFEQSKTGFQMRRHGAD